MPRRGVIYTVAPSPVDGNTIWAGTDDGLIHVTHDGGKTWKNVTPPGIADWAKVSLIDAGHGDVNTAYAAVNGIRLDDMHPHIYKTHDGGATWTEIDNGLPDDPINVVREDPRRKGLLAERRWITVGGIRSTGLTGALGIARHVRGLYEAQFGALSPLNDPVWPEVPNLTEELARPYAQPGRSEIICHCELVTRSEIVAALGGPLPAGTIGGCGGGRGA